MSLGNDQRVRQVAIVLQSMDATTARALLAQFPADVAKTIRRTLTRLGTLSTEERDAAFRDLDQLLQGTPRSSDEVASGMHAASNQTPQVASSTTGFESGLDEVWESRPNPSSDPIDRAFASSPWFSQPSTSQPTSPRLEPPASKFPSLQPGEDSVWSEMGAAALAAALLQERPLVIAAILNHLPLHLASETLQQIPYPVATQALALLPNLHRSDPEALRAICHEIKSKILRGGTPLRAANDGRERLQAILSSLPPEEQPTWTAHLKEVIPDWLTDTIERFPASSLTTPPESFLNPTATPHNASSPNATPPSYRIRADHTTTQDSVELELLQQNASAGSFTVIFPSPSLPSDGNDSPSEPTSIEPNLAAALNNETPHPNVLFMIDDDMQRSMDELLHFSDKDIVRILQSNDPHTVLLSMCHAPLQLRMLVERLLPSKDVQRFRARIESLEANTAFHSDDVVAARRAILDRANSLLATGEISKTPHSKRRRSA